MSDLIYDLHCHSTASDGALPPAELVNRAKQQGVGVLALTDHDTVAGLAEARRAAQECGIRLVSGIELSAGFDSHCLHIVGLNIDPANSRLLEGIARQQVTREERAQKIAQKLVKKGIPDATQTCAPQPATAKLPGCILPIFWSNMATSRPSRTRSTVT
ncbi:PHP domain-containing protein [Methylomonas koyamae]|uniref:PHP domain-containing protein n=1 Tax=Methylomonas koyamae TaxID=702114 RepID=UPI000B1E4508|nr:PHP domain-containing protein [Methylomonas koyamae]